MALNLEVRQKLSYARRTAADCGLSPRAAALFAFYCYMADFGTGKFSVDEDVLDLIDDRFLDAIVAALQQDDEATAAACEEYLREYLRQQLMELV